MTLDGWMVERLRTSAAEEDLAVSQLVRRILRQHFRDVDGQFSERRHTAALETTAPGGP